MKLLQLIAIVFSFIFVAYGNKCTDGVCAIHEQSLRFFVLGDFGGISKAPYYTKMQQSIAGVMGRLGSIHQTHFQMALGDNIYYKGVKTAQDFRFQKTFEEVYTSKATMRPWYIVAGNHDHRLNAWAEVDYSTTSDRWVMPSLNYTFKYSFGTKSKPRIAEFLMVDAVTLVGSILEGLSDEQVMMDMHLEQPMGPRDRRAAERQWQWIEETLKKSKADYLFVASHFPVFSISQHGPTKMLVKRLMPLLHRYRATMYFSGHDHSLQHLKYAHSDGDGRGVSVDYVVSGCASRGNPSVKHIKSVPHGSLLFHYPKKRHDVNGNLFKTGGGVTYAQLEDDQAHMKFYDYNATLIYKFSFKPRY